MPTKSKRSAIVSSPIRNYRTTNGLSRAELANELGVNVTTIYRWEVGLSNPSKLALDRLKTLQLGGKIAPIVTGNSVSRLRQRLSDGKSQSDIVKELERDARVELRLHDEQVSRSELQSTTGQRLAGILTTPRKNLLGCVQIAHGLRREHRRQSPTLHMRDSIAAAASF